MEEIWKKDKEALRQRRQLFAPADATHLDSEIRVALDLADPADAIVEKIHNLVCHPCVHSGAGQSQATVPIDQWVVEVTHCLHHLSQLLEHA